MTVYLFIIAIALTGTSQTGYTVDETKRAIMMKDMDECAKMKAQREFLPPIGFNTAEAYFCVEYGN